MGNAKKNQGIEYLATGKSAEEAVRKLREMEKEGVQEDQIGRASCRERV